MKGVWKGMLILTIATLLAGIGGIIYLVQARYQANEYQFQIDAILAAARVANQGEPVTDADKAVIARYDGEAALIVPGNYIALSSYLRKDAMKPIFARVDREKALQLTFCGQDTLWAQPADEDGDEVLVQLNRGDKTLIMHLRGGNLWTNLLACCLKGTYHDENLPLAQ